MCQRLATDDPKVQISEDEFSKIFSVKQQTVSNWISDIRTKQKGTINGLISHLDFLGWNHTEIGNVVGYTGQRVGQLVTENNTKFSNIFDGYESGKTVGKLAEYYGFDIQTTYAILLKDKTDQERFEILGEEPKVYDIWNFADCNDLMGQEYPGRIPGQIVLNTLYYFTKPGDLIFDLMAGGDQTFSNESYHLCQKFIEDNKKRGTYVVFEDVISILEGVKTHLIFEEVKNCFLDYTIKEKP